MIRWRDGLIISLAFAAGTLGGVLVLVVFLVHDVRDARADCNRKCDASRRDAQGCCPAPARPPPGPPPGPPRTPPPPQPPSQPPHRGFVARWVPAANGQIPPDAAVAGVEQPPANQPLWACRAWYADASKRPGLHPGKVGPHLGSCSISYGAGEFGLRDYEVLMDRVAWVPASGGQVPPRAIEAGLEGPEDGAQTLYLCRVTYPPGTTGVHIGKVRPGIGGCHIGWGGRGNLISEYQVAVEPG
jgi:hypothetical protein